MRILPSFDIFIIRKNKNKIVFSLEIMERFTEESKSLFFSNERMNKQIAYCHHFDEKMNFGGTAFWIARWLLSVVLSRGPCLVVVSKRARSRLNIEGPFFHK